MNSSLRDIFSNLYYMLKYVFGPINIKMFEIISYKILSLFFDFKNLKFVTFCLDVGLSIQTYMLLFH